MMDKLLTPEEIADELRIDPETVRRWCRDGELAAYKLGKQWRIEESAYRQWIEQQHNQARKPDDQ